MSLSNVLRQVKKICQPRPSERREINRIRDKVVNKVKLIASKYDKRLEVILGGSYAKDTWLRKDVDIDIFIRFPKSMGKESLKKIGLPIAEKAVKGYVTRLRFSEHPYLEAWVDQVLVNIVPCFKVKSGDWLSSADRSPFHTDYVRKHLQDSLNDDVRYLKKFIKTIGVYGAEIQTKGFSGYVCEVLIMRYGGFIKTLTALSDIKESEIVSLNDSWENNDNQFHTPIVILDPVDKKRNLGAAISANSLAKMIYAARQFLATPSTCYFSEKDRIKYTPTKKLLEEMIVVTIKHSERSPDIIWGQLQRTGNSLCRQLKSEGFTIFRYSEASDEKNESGFIFLLERLKLSANTINKGPDIFRREEVDQYLLKHKKKSKNIWISDDIKINSLQTRKHQNAVTLLSELFTRKIKNSGIAPGLINEASKTCKISMGQQIISVTKNKQWLLNEVIRISTTDQIINNGAN